MTIFLFQCAEGHNFFSCLSDCEHFLLRCEEDMTNGIRHEDCDHASAETDKLTEYVVVLADSRAEC